MVVKEVRSVLGISTALSKVEEAKRVWHSIWGILALAGIGGVGRGRDVGIDADSSTEFTSL